MRWAIVFYMLVGLFSLGAYIKIGYEHQDSYGKRYTPMQEAKSEH